jgi:hypothetical protein
LYTVDCVAHAFGCYAFRLINQLLVKSACFAKGAVTILQQAVLRDFTPFVLVVVS